MSDARPNGDAYLSTMASDFAYSHLAGLAVEAEGELPAVVHEEQRAALLRALVYGAHPEFVAHTVFASHKGGISLC